MIYDSARMILGHSEVDSIVSKTRCADDQLYEGQRALFSWLVMMLLSMLLTVPALLLAQNQPLRFQHLQIEVGLSQTTVRCIAQDSRGFMWFGTQNGLNRYDGNTIRIFDPAPHLSAQLSNGDIYALHEDRSGAL